MPGDSKNPNDKRPDKQKKSVLVSDHPVFSRIKGDLPHRSKARAFHPKLRWLESLIPLDEKYNLRTKAIVIAMAIFLSFFIYREITVPYMYYRQGLYA